MKSDNRALKILFDHFWTSKGWRPQAERVSPPEDIAYARSVGVMFDVAVFRHDVVVARLAEEISGTSLRAVADAFVSSLSNRNLFLRSSLGSYGVFRWLEQHTRDPSERQCSTCGLYAEEKVDLSALNFERHKWGGVRHDQVPYALFDLERFHQEAGRVVVKAEDVAVLKLLLNAIRAAPPTTTAAMLQKELQRTLPSNKPEREQLVAILGFAGILSPGDRPTFRQRFIRYKERETPNHHFAQTPYPACWWHGSDGVDEATVAETFGHLL